MKLSYLSIITNLVLVLPLYGEGQPSLQYKIHRPNTNLQLKTNCTYADLKASDFPTDVSLALTIKKLDESTFSKKVSVDSEQRLIDIKTGKEFCLVFGKFANGEPIECILSDEKDLSSSVLIIPKPIQITDKNGHNLSLRMACKNGEIFFIEAAGFEPNEKLTYCSISESEVIRTPIQATPDGKFCCYALPAVLNIISGKASVEIIGKTTDHLKVKYIWGPAAFN